ncbi:MAG TPA: FtsX-like permease family protein, partial [Acidimicrobiia bacterium]|nr:FtsX-like permease family protein [Acidimicrobiia bacterium]
RGASRGQVALGATLTGLALIAPATVLAWAVTDLVFPGTDGLVPSRGAALFAAAGTIATLISGLPAARASLEPGRGGAGPVKEPGARRVVAEVFVMVAAVGAVILLRRRGHAEASSDAPVDVDLLLAITPALVGLAAGIIAIRVMPSIMRLLSWLGARRTTVVGFVGYRRLMSMPASARAPILVILVAVTVAVFTSVVRTSIETGQSEHMWQLTGADLRLEHRSPGAALPGAVDPVELAAGGPWAEAALFPDTRIIADASYPLSLLLAIDSSAYQEVLEGTPFDPELVSGLAGGEGPIPALVSSRLGVVPPAVGTELSLEMGEIDPEVVVAGVIDRFPSVPPDEPFVVVALDRLREARGELQVPATTLFLRADEPEAIRIAETVSPPVRAVSRYQIGATLTADPLARLADGTLAGVFYLSSAFALVAAVSLFSATAGRRRHDLGLLRILGLTRDQSAGVTALELGPPVLTATLIGGVTGAMVALLLEPALDIDSFTGGLLPAEIFVDWRPLIVVTALILTVVAGAVAIFVVVSRSEDEGTLLRVGED